MSKSKGNVIDPLIVIDQYGTDAFRFLFSLRVGSAGGYFAFRGTYRRGKKFCAQNMECLKVVTLIYWQLRD